MRIVVTGATGHLGRLVADALVRRGIAASDIVAAGRNPDRLDALAAAGFTAAAIDYDDPVSLRKAFDGADKLLLVASHHMDRRTTQHLNAINAACDVGVGLVAYTSLAGAATNSSGLAPSHRATEEALRSSGNAFVLLRNGWFMENFTEAIPRYRKQRRVVGACGDGRVSAATRADLADAAAHVLTSVGHEGITYELGGDEAFTMADFAAELGRRVGSDIPWANLEVEEYEQFLLDKDFGPKLARLYTSFDESLAADELLVRSGDLSRLLGRPTTSMSKAVVDALTA
ncbi:SDR family oxidoreductase [Rhodococcus sp. WS4]|nr:SDR family oxidoreductase [Rhodococcus sp. WS4]